MNSQIYSPSGGSVGIGFAIPSALVRQIVTELREKGHIDRGWLGVSVRDAPASGHQPAGAGIAVLDRGGPAARAGLRPGDVILTVNDQAVQSARGLIRDVALTPPGHVMRLGLRRQGRSLDVPVTIGLRPKIEED
jgi:serine protease Do